MSLWGRRNNNDDSYYFRILNSNNYSTHADTALTDNPGDGKDPEDIDNDKNKKKKLKPIDTTKEITLKQTSMKTHLADYKKLYESIKYNEPKEISLVCPRCIQLIKFKKVKPEQGAMNPITFEPVIVYYCTKCKHRFSDLYEKTYPYATIDNLCKFNAYIGNFQGNIQITEFGS